MPKRTCSASAFALLALAVLGLWPLGSAHAARELFNEPAVQAPAAAAKALSDIEPASGGEKPAEHGAAAAEASPHGESKGGKELNAPKGLPEVKIGQATVQRHTDLISDAESRSLPLALKGTLYAGRLARRMSFTPFAHSPRLGPASAPITVVVFEDLSCTACAPQSAPVTTLIEALGAAEAVSDTQLIWVHTPSARWQGTNLGAFYGKLAARNNLFWPFRAALLKAPARDSETAFGVLTSLGVDPRAIRQMMLTEARRFYRELDGDTLQANSLGLDTPPVVLVNGIVLGAGAIPLELLPDVVTYLRNRIAAGLDEPPL